jgi:hypothetical protein
MTFNSFGSFGSFGSFSSNFIAQGYASRLCCQDSKRRLKEFISFETGSTEFSFKEIIDEN